MHMRQLKEQEARNQASLTLWLQDIHALKLIIKTDLLNPEHLLENNDAKNHDLEYKTLPGHQGTLGHEGAYWKRDGVDQLDLWGDLHDEVCGV